MIDEHLFTVQVEAMERLIRHAISQGIEDLASEDGMRSAYLDALMLCLVGTYLQAITAEGREKWIRDMRGISEACAFDDADPVTIA